MRRPLNALLDLGETSDERAETISLALDELREKLVRESTPAVQKANNRGTKSSKEKAQSRQAQHTNVSAESSGSEHAPAANAASEPYLLYSHYDDLALATKTHIAKSMGNAYTICPEEPEQEKWIEVLARDGQHCQSLLGRHVLFKFNTQGEPKLSNAGWYVGRVISTIERAEFEHHTADGDVEIKNYNVHFDGDRDPEMVRLSLEYFLNANPKKGSPPHGSWFLVEPKPLHMAPSGGMLRPETNPRRQGRPSGDGRNAPPTGPTSFGSKTYKAGFVAGQKAASSTSSDSVTNAKKKQRSS